MGQWQNGTACPTWCLSGYCTECAPGSVRCTGVEEVEKCSSTGKWVWDQECTYACINGVCGGVCVPGESRCNGLKVETCSEDGQWVVSKTCAYVCSNAVCTGVCHPNDKRCDIYVPQTCNSSGLWVGSTACSPPGCLDGVCTPLVVVSAPQTVGIYRIYKITSLGAPKGTYTMYEADNADGKVSLRKDGVADLNITYDPTIVVGDTYQEAYTIVFPGRFSIQVYKATFGSATLGAMPSSIFDGIHAIVVP